MVKIAILSGPENRSPKVLAETINQFLTELDCSSKVFYKAKAITRLLSAKRAHKKKILWGVTRLLFFLSDKIFFSKLKKYDAILLCGCTPYAFYSYSYDIKKLKKTIRKPVIYYSVQYLENSPTIKKILMEGGHELTERFDWHLAVSSVTELKGLIASPWSQIGLFLKKTGLKPSPRSAFKALVDFPREGYEHYTEIQIRALDELKIPYIILEGEYSHNQLRKIYSEVALFFIQFPEAYGMPIAECLACGTYVFVGDSSWPMSWRLDEKPEVHGPGTLPECFIVYNDFEDLKKKLSSLKSEYNFIKTPLQVFNTFFKNYPTFYEGNRVALLEVLEMIEKNDFT